MEKLKIGTLNSICQDSGKSTVEKLEYVVLYILQNTSACSKETAMSSGDLFSKYNELRDKHKQIVELSQNSFNQYISKLANMDSSPIVCPGKRQGYYIDEDYDSLNTKSDSPEVTSSLTEKDEYKESEMYPILVEWLSMALKDEPFKRVSDVSATRVMDKWGNPDILGIAKTTYFGTTSIELTTIEAKRTFKSWRDDIFEAVSHTMLANKAYYAYLRKESDKGVEDMVLYAQKFGIGILALVVPDEKWGKPLKYENIDFKVVVPAVQQQPVIKIQKKYLNGLGITDFDKLEQWGK